MNIACSLMFVWDSTYGEVIPEFSTHTALIMPRADPQGIDAPVCTYVCVCACVRVGFKPIKLLCFFCPPPPESALFPAISWTREGSHAPGKKERKTRKRKAAMPNFVLSFLLLHKMPRRAYECKWWDSAGGCVCVNPCFNRARGVHFQRQPAGNAQRKKGFISYLNGGGGRGGYDMDYACTFFGVVFLLHNTWVRTSFMLAPAGGEG